MEKVTYHNDCEGNAKPCSALCKQSFQASSVDTTTLELALESALSKLMSIRRNTMLDTRLALPGEFSIRLRNPLHLLGLFNQLVPNILLHCQHPFSTCFCSTQARQMMKREWGKTLFHPDSQTQASVLQLPR